MSEPAPPAGTGDLAGVAGPLTPEAIDRVLADFRAWLEQLAARPESEPPAEELPGEDDGGPPTIAPSNRDAGSTIDAVMKA